MTQVHCARHQILDLACEVSLYRVIGNRHFYELIKHAGKVAQAAVREGVPISTPITDLFTDQRDKYDSGETLGWHYRRAYGCADTSLNPFRFFTISYTDSLVTIESQAVGGASGEIQIDDRSVSEIFRCAKYNTPSSYRRWAYDVHPVGGSPRLLRMDDGENRLGQLRLEAGDLHPCRGSLYFGEQQQESDQLAAFCRLEEHVRALFAEKKPTDAQRAEAKKRAQAIIGQANTICFIPGSGYCHSCGGDITLGVTDLSTAASQTGCHLCGSTWCD